MKKKRLAEQGQALILIALAAIGLFGIAALAIDGSIKFSDRRHAQNAADTAVMAGALELAREETPNPDVWYIVAQNVAKDNGYDGDLLRSRVWAYYCSDDATVSGSLRFESPGDCGPYEGDDEYIQVVIVSYVNTYFARVLGINQTTNTVQAVAQAKPGGDFYDGNLIVALNPNPCSGGGADANVTLGTAGGASSEAVINLDGGGIYVNSGGSDECGMNLVGCPTINVDGNLGSSGSGNIDLTTSSAECADKLNVPTPTFDNEAYDFPPRMPAEPDECTAPNGQWTNDAAYTATSPGGEVYNGITILEPGRYNEFPPTSGAGSTVFDHVLMLPGIYCVNDSVKTSDKKLWLEGDDVTIYIRPGYKFSYEGGTIDLSATTDSTSPYKGYVLIVASDFSGSATNCKIGGNTYNSFSGTIFAPYCNLTINGSSDANSYNAQVIAYTVKLTGSAVIDLYYDEGENAQDPPELGLIR